MSIYRPLALLLALAFFSACPGAPTDDDDSATTDDDDDDDSASGLRETALNALSVEFEDGDGDGVWSPGEVLNITATVTNEGPFEHMSYPSFLLETTAPEVDLGLNPTFTFFGMMVGTEELAYWQITAPANSATPQTIEFSITGVAMDPTEPCGGDGPWEPPCITSTPLVFSVTLG